MDSPLDAHFLEVGSRIDLTLRSVDARESKTDFGKIDLAKFKLDVDTVYMLVIPQSHCFVVWFSLLF